MDKIRMTSEDALRLIAKSLEMGKYDNALKILHDIGESNAALRQGIREAIEVISQYNLAAKTYKEEIADKEIREFNQLRVTAAAILPKLQELVKE